MEHFPLFPFNKEVYCFYAKSYFQQFCLNRAILHLLHLLQVPEVKGTGKSLNQYFNTVLKYLSAGNFTLRISVAKWRLRFESCTLSPFPLSPGLCWFPLAHPFSVIFTSTENTVFKQFLLGLARQATLFIYFCWNYNCNQCLTYPHLSFMFWIKQIELFGAGISGNHLYLGSFVHLSKRHLFFPGCLSCSKWWIWKKKKSSCNAC